MGPLPRSHNNTTQGDTSEGALPVSKHMSQGESPAEVGGNKAEAAL